MAILAECDICGNQHRIKDGLVGSSIRCKDCGVLFKVLAGPSISTENFIEEEGRLRRRDLTEVNTFWPRIVAVLVATLVVVFLIAAVWTLASLLKTPPKLAHHHSSCSSASMNFSIVQER